MEHVHGGGLDELGGGEDVSAGLVGIVSVLTAVEHEHPLVTELLHRRPLIAGSVPRHRSPSLSSDRHHGDSDDTEEELDAQHANDGSLDEPGGGETHLQSC